MYLQIKQLYAGVCCYYFHYQIQPRKHYIYFLLPS